MEERARPVAAEQASEHEAKVAARQAQRAAGPQPRGPAPAPPSAVPEPKAQDNFTAPERRSLKAGSGAHFEQACHAQAAVDGALFVVGARGSDAPNDKQELPASGGALRPVVAAEVPAVLAESGFYRDAAVAAVEQQPDGPPSGLRV
jgi:hypothetical protein